jgi:large subunit ribosomal protein L32
MGALPKRKVSRRQAGNRRRHQFLTAPHLVTCPQCGALMRAHHACKACGTYKGRQVIKIDDDRAEAR